VGEVLGLVLGEASVTYQQLGVATGSGVTLAGGDRRDRTTPPAGSAHPRDAGRTCTTKTVTKTVS
jgi:hypothetical protein